MTDPWKGAAHRASADDFVRAAERIGCELAAIRAVWQVEASGRAFRADGTLERRFEPHKLRMPIGDYRSSLKLSAAGRERLFRAAYARDPEDAMRATSWGAPQIMGFNAGAAGYITALGMVRAMAASEAEQLAAFVTLILSWGLDAALRAHDWRAFAARYNGSGNVAEYAARIETAYQQLSGRASPVVLRAGARGEAVRRLQVALGLDSDGAFGPETEAAVRRFQAQSALPVDGVVGARTWAELERRRDASPIRQPAREDRVAQITKVSAAAGGLASAVAAIGDALPESTLNILIGGGMLLALIGVAVWAFQKSRGVA
ncbi:N-acetylmuramidase domain-containing protein [Haematobacter genomosp. 1]|uniref:Peptidoglycan-binding protein n=1 Tax=Haematobacter genomosp. 1 TaxID=366618 RepID=A0A212ACF3_9RHOB|nr:N-acetylmuramidase domain-containing protein [Haematobacter genomosp. 1]OWJ78435.1 hypothetical protein CDV49_08340 [Haematobacter genomosp. 1]